MDSIVEAGQQALLFVRSHWSSVEAFATLKTPYVREIAVASNSINGAVAAYKLVAEQEAYWLQSLVLSVLRTYGGGIVAPMLIGRPSQIFNNDVIVFTAVVAWYLVHYCGGHAWLQRLPVKMLWSFFLGVFRANAQTAIVGTASTVFSASAWYPTPVFGPIVVGTVVGSMGQFMPLDKGLSALARGSPWNLQGAFYTASFYHFMVNDQRGWIGQTFRAIFGTHSATTVVLIIAAVQVIQLELHAILTPEANLFAPIHRLLYLIFPVNGPKPAPGATSPWTNDVRARLGWLLEIARILLVVAVVLMHFSVSVVPVSLSTISLSSSSVFPPSLTSQNHSLQSQSLSGKEHNALRDLSLAENEAIGSCQWLHVVRPCTPHLLRFEKVPCSADVSVCSSADSSAEYFRLARYNAVASKHSLRETDLSKWFSPVETIPLALVPAITSERARDWSLVFAQEGGVVIHSAGEHTAVCGETCPVEYFYVPVDGVKGLAKVNLNFATGVIAGEPLKANKDHSEL